MSADHARINPAALIAMLIWSGASVAGKFALLAIGPISLTGMRYLLGAPVLLLMLSAPQRRTLLVPGPQQRRLVIAATMNAVNISCWAIGLSFTTASHTVLLYATAPVWAALIAAAVGLDQFRRYVLAGGIIAVLGVALIVSPGLTTGGGLLGDAIIFFGTLLFAGTSILMAQSIKHYGTLPCTAGMMVVGTLVTLPLTALPMATLNWGAVPIESWLGFAYSGLGAFILGQILWYRGLGQLGSTQATLYAFLQPVFGLVIAAVALGERLDPVQLGGAAVVLIGVAMAQGRLNGLPARFAVQLR